MNDDISKDSSKLKTKLCFFEVSNRIQGLLVKSGYENKAYNKSVSETLYSIARYIIDRSKTINDLIELGSKDSIGVLARSLLEIYISLEYILEENSKTQRRERAFFYNSRLNHLKSISELEKLDPEGNIMYRPEDCDKEVKDAKNVNDLRKYYRREYKKLFTYSSTTNSEYRNWFDIDEKNPTSIGKLATKVKIDRELFVMFYQLGSMDVHGSGVYNYIAVRVGIESLVPVNAIEQLSMIIVRNSLNIIREYFDLETEEFKTHFLLMEDYLNKSRK